MMHMHLSPSDPKYVEKFHQVFAPVTGGHYGVTWALNADTVTLSRRRVRSTVECGLLCQWEAQCSAFHVIKDDNEVTCIMEA